MSSEMTGSAAEVDRRIMVRLQNGDMDALAELYDRYAALAMGVALRVVRDRNAAEDAVHDSFLAVWRKARTFDAQRGSVRSWLLTVVRHRAIDRVRRSVPTMDVADADEQSLIRSDADPTLAAAVASMSADELAQAMRALPNEQRRAVELAYFEGHTYREVARLMNISPGTAAGRLRLALQRLRTILVAVTSPEAAEVAESRRRGLPQ
jgi:RNA polymerase sigma-70 factor (ECF subfamily)